MILDSRLTSDKEQTMLNKREMTSLVAKKTEAEIMARMDPSWQKSAFNRGYSAGLSKALDLLGQGHLGYSINDAVNSFLDLASPYMRKCEDGHCKAGCNACAEYSEQASKDIIAGH